MQSSITDIIILYGALAQLGARLTGSQEVRGSIPLCSTKDNNQDKQSGLFFLWYFLKRSRKKSVPQWIDLMFYGLALLHHCYTIIFYGLIAFIVLPALKKCFYEISLTVVLSPKTKKSSFPKMKKNSLGQMKKNCSLLFS